MDGIPGVGSSLLSFRTCFGIVRRFLCRLDNVFCDLSRKPRKHPIAVKRSSLVDTLVSLQAQYITFFRSTSS